MDKLGASDLIQEVTFMGGAVKKFDKTSKWLKIFSRQVSGQIKNVFTERDFILLMYSGSQLG